MADVFISYARDNEAVVRALAEAVAREGYSVWWDEALPPHLSYSDVIAGEIAKARAVIVVWSEEAVASEWVRAEADLARNQKKLVQTSIDGRMPPMPFNQLHFVSIGDWRGEPDHPGWVRVKESLAALCGGAGAQPAYAFPPTAPPRPGPAPTPPPPARSAFRMVLICVGGLLLLGLAAAVFWFDGASRAPVAENRPPARGSQPRLSAPVQAPRAASAPTASPARAQPEKPQAASARPQTGTVPDRQTEAQALNMRRYCSGPGRGTPQCRQLRARVTATR